MRWLLVLPPLLAASPLVAQGQPEKGLCLDERLERPLVYARLAPATGDAHAPSLLQHPVLVGLGRALAADEGAARRMGDLAARAAGSLEIAWTATIPARAGTDEGDRPLLLLRARLEPEDAGRLAELLAAGGMAVPHRRVGGHQTYLLGHEGEERPGGQVEVVLSAGDLLVSNHGRALEEVLGAAELRGPALAGDPDYIRLRERLDARPGALLVFADMRQLLHRVPWDLRGAPLPREVLAVLEPDGRGLSASLVLDSGAGAPWSASLRPAAAGELLAVLRSGAGLALSLAGDPPRPRGARGAVPRTGNDRGRGGRRGRALLEGWERTGAALGAAMRFERRGDLGLLLVAGGGWDNRLGALLRDLSGPRAEVVGMFAFTLPVPGGEGLMRVAGTLEPEPGADGGRLLRVRALCATDG